MAYHPSWVIYCQSHPYRRTVLISFNQLLVEVGGKRYHTFFKGISLKVNVQARLEFELAR